MLALHADDREGSSQTSLWTNQNRDIKSLRHCPFIRWNHCIKWNHRFCKTNIPVLWKTHWKVLANDIAFPRTQNAHWIYSVRVSCHIDDKFYIGCVGLTSLGRPRCAHPSGVFFFPGRPWADIYPRSTCGKNTHHDVTLLVVTSEYLGLAPECPYPTAGHMGLARGALT